MTLAAIPPAVPDRAALWYHGDTMYRQRTAAPRRPPCGSTAARSRDWRWPKRRHCAARVGAGGGCHAVQKPVSPGPECERARSARAAPIPSRSSSPPRARTGAATPGRTWHWRCRPARPASMIFSRGTARPGANSGDLISRSTATPGRRPPCFGPLLSALDLDCGHALADGRLRPDTGLHGPRVLGQRFVDFPCAAGCCIRSARSPW